MTRNLAIISTLEEQITALTKRLQPPRLEAIAECVDALKHAGFKTPHGIPVDKLLREYEFGLAKAPVFGLRLAVKKLKQGEIESPHGFIPLPSQLAQMAQSEARTILEDLTRLKARREAMMRPAPELEHSEERLRQTSNVRALNAEFQAWHNGAPAGPLMQAAFQKHFGDRMDAERQRMAREGRKFLCSVTSHTVANEMAKRGKVPPGSVYSGLLGEFYSPIQQQPEGSDHDGIEQPLSDFAARYGPDTSLSAGPDQVRERGQDDTPFDTERPADEQTANSETSGTLDGDRGSTGLATAAE